MVYIAFFLACTVIALQFFLLQALFKDTIFLQSVFESQLKAIPKHKEVDDEHYGLSVGTALPEFSVAALGEQEPVTRNTLLGESSLLLFLDLHKVAEMTKIRIASIINYLAGKSVERLYVICSDSREACAEFKQQQELNRMYGARVVVCIDTAESLTKSFGALSRPCAMIVDEHAIVQKIGGLNQQGSKISPQADISRTGTDTEPSFSNAI